MKVKVLGTTYEIVFKEEKSEPMLEKCSAYCDWTSKRIIVSKHKKDPYTYDDLERLQKKHIRHELVHAFLDESGLQNDSDWARNEEIVDWIAMQFPKMMEAMRSVGAL